MSFVLVLKLAAKLASNLEFLLRVSGTRIPDACFRPLPPFRDPSHQENAPWSKSRQKPARVKNHFQNPMHLLSELLPGYRCRMLTYPGIRVHVYVYIHTVPDFPCLKLAVFCTLSEVGSLSFVFNQYNLKVVVKKLKHCHWQWCTPGSSLAMRAHAPAETLPPLHPPNRL